MSRHTEPVGPEHPEWSWGGKLRDAPFAALSEHDGEESQGNL